MDKVITSVIGAEATNASNIESPNVTVPLGPSLTSVDDAEAPLGDGTAGAATGSFTTDTLPALSMTPNPEETSTPPTERAVPLPMPDSGNIGATLPEEKSAMDDNDIATSVDTSVAAGVEPMSASGSCSEASASGMAMGGSIDDVEMDDMRK